MKLYRISQTVNTGWDTYSDAVVAAESEDEARKIHPYANEWGEEWHEADERLWGSGTWAHEPSQVAVEYLGEACAEVKRGVVCASFHAG